MVRFPILTLLLVLGALANFSTMALAQNVSFEDAVAKQNQGRYYQALEIASQLNTADGLALAARSRLILVRFYLETEDRLAQIELALEEALKALAIDPTHLEGNLQAAVAWGLKARIRDKASDARKSKTYIDLTLKYHPQSAWGWAALGGWNGEVVQRAGGFFARIMFGARRKISQASFNKSIELSENKIPFYLSYARSLLKYKGDKYRPEAIKNLTLIEELEPQNHLDKITIKFAAHLLRALETKNEEELERLLDDFAPPPEL